jgi:hypothetical protein
MMLKRHVKRVLLSFGLPVRTLIRHELNSRRAIPAVNCIQTEMQRRATSSTVDYIDRHMRDVDSVGTGFEVLSRAVSEADLHGHHLVLEFGVFSGRSINHIASQCKTQVFGFDSFEGLPERWRDGFPRGTFRVPHPPRVRPNVTLVKGWFDESLPGFLANHDGMVGLLHVDCDLYSSTNTVLTALADRIGVGCVIVFDEYFNYPGWENGEYRAFQEFIARTGLKYEYLVFNSSHEQVAVRIC